MNPAVINPQLWWLTARATGIVAWSVLSISVVLGMALSTRALGRRPTPAWLQDLHRGSGGLAIAFTVVHLAALLADTYVQFDIADLLVPLMSQWRPVPVAAGIVAFWLLLAVEATSLARRRIGITWWRRIHLTSFALWVLATAHLLTAGTDAGKPWLWGIVLATTLTVATLGLLRLRRPRRRRSGNSRPGNSRSGDRRTGDRRGGERAPTGRVTPGPGVS